MSLRSMVLKRFFKFVDKRIPRNNTHCLTVKNLLIVPSKLGAAYLGICLLLWVFGTNYQNNLILAFDFFLVSVFFLGILRTFANLNGISLIYKSAQPVFPGEHINLNFEFSSSKNTFGIVLKWQKETALYRFCDFIQNLEEIGKPRLGKADVRQLVSVPLLATSRGKFPPGRLLIESHYPIGIVRCWAWLTWDVELLVYPQPIEVPEPVCQQQVSEGGESHPAPGAEDFSGLRSYRAGDSPKRIAWKTYAKGKGVYTKEFEQAVSNELWLDFNSVLAVDLESKVSGLTYWVLKYHERDVEFGVKLPGHEISPNRGDDHLHEILSVLAVYGIG